MFTGNTLLITGGTGSFGNAVLHRFINTDIKEIRIFSRDEKKQEDMRRELNCDKVRFYIGDVRDYQSLEKVLKGVDYVFHAAALKQVPSCEFHPIEAVKTNVLGAQNLLRASIENNVKKAVVLSTDKAVYPINAMGMSKALMEKVMVAMSRDLNENETVLCGTRYGNVMASRGSVIPLFVKQILEGSSITVTDPDMTRFMMSLENAIDLVLFAFSNAGQGDIFVQKAPSATMHDLAAALKDIFNADNEIKIIGTRHGEKLYETLLTREEMSIAEDFGDYFRIPADNRDLNYEKYLRYGKKLASGLSDYNSHNTHRLTFDELKKMLLSLDYIQKELILQQKY
ncbi:MAG: NAD-dependent epimerase/dehydratase family protein [Ruminiclostridium sp.]|nr:NAD-dependent epimerase/dehydratase family protein [Ruminiclostridium sp.]